MAMFEQAGSGEPRNRLSDWMSRGAVALFFVFAGADKFSDSWVKLFHEIGIGEWFRYFTGVVEILGGVLVLIPRTVTAGLAILGCTMASAVLILVFVIKRPADSVFSGLLVIVLAGYWWIRRSEP
jgi:putative oxidoreductase